MVKPVAQAVSIPSNPSNSSASQDYIRKSPRVPVTVVVETTGKALTLCFARNISANGILLEVPGSEAFLEVGQSLQLRFNLPFGQQAVEANSRIVSVGQTTDFSGRAIFSAGIEFVDLNPIGQSEIQSYIERYQSAQKQQLQNPATSTTDFKAQPVAFYLSRAQAQLLEKATLQSSTDPFWQLLQKLNVTEQNQLRQDNDVQPVLRNALGLFLKISFESQQLRPLFQQGKLPQPIVDEYYRLINYECDLCIEGLQQLQAQAISQNDDSLKSQCIGLRDRLTGALGNTKNLFKPVHQEINSTPAMAMHGPWGDIRNIEHYQKIFAAYFAKKLDNPIEEGEIEHFLNDYPKPVRPMMQQPKGDTDSKAILQVIYLTYKIKDEHARLRNIQGQHLEHMEAIREIFRHTSKTVSQTHEPLRNLIKTRKIGKPTPAEDEKYALLQLVSAKLLDAYSQISDFANLLVPGAVALSDQNLQYTKGAFQEALKQKAIEVQRWVIKRQRKFIYATIFFLLLAAAYHLKDVIVWKTPFEVSEYKPPFTLSGVYLSQGELVATIARKNWLAHPRMERQELTFAFFQRLRAGGIEQIRLLDEKAQILVATLSNGKQQILSYTQMKEDDITGDGSTLGR